MTTYNDEIAAISRSPQTLVVMTLDFCSRVFGTSPCLATGEPCYNTWSTCKYPSAWLNAGKDYEFSLSGKPIIGPGVRPYLEEHRELPTEIDPTRGVAVNAKVTLKLRDDENDTDVGIDPYVAQRASVQGSFWKKLMARNPYYPGRTVVIKRGFTGIPKASYVTRFKGIIDSVKGPSDKGVEIVLKDYLKKADRVDVPAATKGKVTDNPLAQGAATINLDDASEYPASGWVAVDQEIIQYTGKSGNQLTGCTRGKAGTTDAQHSQGAMVQLCAVWESQNPWDIIYDILTNHVGMAAGDIDVTGAEAERDTWLQGYTFTAYVTKPVKASELLRELCEQCHANIWWDQEGQKVAFKVTAPAAPGQSVKAVNDTANIVEGSTDLDRNEEARVSTVIVYYDKYPFAEDGKPESYGTWWILPDADKEGANEYGARAAKKIFSRWITQGSTAKVLANRIMGRFAIPPQKYFFDLELKDDDLKAGALVNVTSDDIVDVTGAPEERTFQVLRKEPKGANRVGYTAMDTAFDVRFGFIGNQTNDWDSATNAEKEFGYIGDASNRLNGEDGFYVS